MVLRETVALEAKAADMEASLGVDRRELARVAADADEAEAALAAAVREADAVLADKETINDKRIEVNNSFQALLQSRKYGFKTQYAFKKLFCFSSNKLTISAKLFCCFGPLLNFH